MPPSGSPNAPEKKAREKIDALLEQSGWVLQDRAEMNLTLPAVAVREFALAKGHGFADYLLFLDGQPVGVCEAKETGTLVRDFEVQARKYVGGVPPELDTKRTDLPLVYISTGDETAFYNLRDPHPHTREVFSFHRPETVREWLSADTLDAWIKCSVRSFTAADDEKPPTSRARLRAMPPVILPGLWPKKLQAVTRIEKSLFDDRPRSLIQVATGTGKALPAVTTLYRLIKFGGARRVLFLVDRANLGEQAEKEFRDAGGCSRTRSSLPATSAASTSSGSRTRAWSTRQGCPSHMSWRRRLPMTSAPRLSAAELKKRLVLPADRFMARLTAE
jgi:type I restriction enzyme, R subunit